MSNPFDSLKTRYDTIQDAISKVTTLETKLAAAKEILSTARAAFAQEQTQLNEQLGIEKPVTTSSKHGTKAKKTSLTFDSWNHRVLLVLKGAKTPMTIKEIQNELGKTDNNGYQMGYNALKKLKEWNYVTDGKDRDGNNVFRITEAGIKGLADNVKKTANQLKAESQKG